MVRSFLVLACAVSLGSPAALSAGEPSARVFVLEAEPPAVAAVALDSGASLARLALSGTPEHMLLSPDHSRLVVLDRGPGKETMRFGYHPTGKSTATVVDPATLKEVGRAADLCWTVDLGAGAASGVREPGVFSADGRRLTLPCLGYRSQKPEEALPRELVTVDLATGQVAARAAVPRVIDAFLALPAGDTAVVYSGREAPKNQPALSAELRFVDLGTLEVKQTVALEGDPGPPTLAPGGEYLYLLEYGKPDDKPAKNVNGRVQVVSLARRAHEANIDAGRAPRGLVVDEDGRQVLLLSDGTPSVEKKDDRPGELRVIRGAALAATVPVGEGPLFLRASPERERVYVVSENALTTVDMPALSAQGSSTLKRAGMSLMSSGAGRGTAKELEISADGKRGYVLYQASSKLGILDLDSGQLVGEVTTGRGSVKFGKFLAAMAATAGSYSAGSAAASSNGGGLFFYNVYGVAPANTQVVLSADDAFVYVLNTNSNDVTVVNTATREVVTKIGVGGAANRLELLPGGAFVAVTTGADTLHLIDTRTNAQVSELPDGGNYVHSPDKRYAAAIGKNVVYCLDGASLKTLGKATGFKKPLQLVFAPAP